jgi:transcriptional regulator with PAS, ATPase and Fis domain
LPIELKVLIENMPTVGGEHKLKDAVAKLEYAMIQEMFEKYGNVRDAARALGIDASTFVRKRMKYEQELSLKE